MKKTETVVDKKILFECRLLKQVIYKIRNQLGRSLQYRRLKEVYRCLLRYLDGESVPGFLDVLQKAGISVLDPLVNKILTPLYSVLLSIYSRIYCYVQNKARITKPRVISKKLKKIMELSERRKSENADCLKEKFRDRTQLKTQKNIKDKVFEPQLDKISQFLESIRSSLGNK